MNKIWSLASCVALAACATAPRDAPGPVGGSASPSLPHSSPECLAKKLRTVDPFPESEIPPAAMARRQSGQVAIRYDVVDGASVNLVIVASNPAGVYDAAALAWAARYREPTKTTVRGCVMTLDVRF